MIVLLLLAILLVLALGSKGAWITVVALAKLAGGLAVIAVCSLVLVVVFINLAHQ